MPKLLLVALLFTLVMPPVVAQEGASSLLEEGRKLQEQRQFKTAQQTLVRALKMEPANLAVQDALLAVCKDEVTETPLSPDAHIDLGNAFAFCGNFHSAEAELYSASRLSFKLPASKLVQMAEKHLQARK